MIVQYATTVTALALNFNLLKNIKKAKTGSRNE
jgi:hypothetical protein